MVCPGYWAARHSSKLDDVERIFKIAERLTRRLPPPWGRSRRGRRPKFSARRHAAICVTKQFFDYALREVEGQAPSFMGKTIDHSTVGKAFKRLRANYVKLLIVLLRREIERLVKCELYIVDSTGISTPCLRRRKKAFRTVYEHEVLKLHALVGYSRRAGALVVFAARVTPSNVADCTQLGRLLEGLRAEGEPLLGDKGYDSQRNLELTSEHGFKPVIKPRTIEYHGIFRKQMLREFKRCRKLYRQRGIAEAFFGGIENRYGARTRCKLSTTKATSILLMAVAHNLRTLARVRAMKAMRILVIIWIYSTNSREPQAP
ncbi:MAG: transposase [Hadesarchaea archaeon]|nr:transposase [Hadesarchaea archaeon]